MTTNFKGLSYLVADITGGSKRTNTITNASELNEFIEELTELYNCSYEEAESKVNLYPLGLGISPELWKEESLDCLGRTRSVEDTVEEYCMAEVDKYVKEPSSTPRELLTPVMEALMVLGGKRTLQLIDVVEDSASHTLMTNFISQTFIGSESVVKYYNLVGPNSDGIVE
jgi:hypothetical protein